MIGEEAPSTGNSSATSASASASNTSTASSRTTATTSTTSTSPKIPVAAENDKKRHERLLVVYAPLVGTRVTVFLYDGAVFEGTLDSFETVNEFALILRMSTMIRPGREVIDPSIKAGVTFELMNIRFDDMAELKPAASKSTGGIGTDAAISKKKGDFVKERELHRWLPESGSSSSAVDGPAASLNSETAGQWDQFATNEKLFGLKTDFDEEMYTTKLDRSSAHIRANEANAERIAKEIMKGSSGGNVHLAEERGQEFEEVDEETLYGAVVRQDCPSGTLPPGFTGNDNPATQPSPVKSTLNPAAAEFKLNIDAPEFNPSSTTSKVTYYNQPRRNLNYGYAGGYPSGGYGGYQQQGAVPYGYPQGVPYYYVPPVPVTMPVAQNTVAPSTTTTTETKSSSSSTMNPEAADFIMPAMAQPYYPTGGYYYPQRQQGYYYNNNHNNNYNNNNNNNTQ